jgi:hypothetical protein
MDLGRKTPLTAWGPDCVYSAVPNLSEPKLAPRLSPSARVHLFSYGLYRSSRPCTVGVVLGAKTRILARGNSIRDSASVCLHD